MHWLPTALGAPDQQPLLELLFETYPLYDDRESRHAVQKVFTSLVSGPNGASVLPAITTFLKQESQKKSITPAKAFVLVDFCSVLLLQFAASPELWSKFGLDVALANAQALEKCMGAGTDRRAGRIAASALVSTRRALRAIFRSETIGKDALSTLVATLTTKGPTPTPGNAVLLGVIAGVSSRLPTVKPQLEKLKQDYYVFYVREVVGSKTQVPNHISNALHDFFDTFPTLPELRKDIIPPIEKALLRAPEVVLNDVVSPMILALPEAMDLSEVLLENLLKPLLANVKSTNPAIRAGVLQTFEALASRSQNEQAIEKVTKEILDPLKQGKVSGVDQKVLHAQMLSAVPKSLSLSGNIPSDIASVALKESNEPVIVAEVSAMIQHLTFGLANGASLDKATTDAFVKGMADKRVPIKKLWAIRAMDLWWSLSDAQYSQPDILAFCHTSLPKLIELWQEVISNPISATQTGLITVGHYVSALLLEKVQSSKDDKLSAIYKKSDVFSQSLALQPKPSFLLNPKVYSKLSSEEDVVIALRALAAVTPFFVQDGSTKEVENAWAQCFIFFLVAQSVSTKAKSASRQALTQLYLSVSVEKISDVMIQGLWSWYRSIEREDKESAAIASKTVSGDLGIVLACLCLSPEALKSFKGSVEHVSLCKQAMNLVVIARPEIMNKVSWIDLCLRMGVDPGQLVRENVTHLMRTVNEVTEVIHAQLITHLHSNLCNRTSSTTDFQLSTKQLMPHTPIWPLLHLMWLWKSLYLNLVKILIRNNSRQ